MDAGDRFPTVDVDCQIAAAWVTYRLEQLGLRVLRSFDLRTAACVSNPEDLCPHHGTGPCNCQMVVLLVYGQAGPPLSLVAHGYDHHTGFYVVDDPSHPTEPEMHDLMQRAFDEPSLGAKPAGSVSHAA